MVYTLEPVLRKSSQTGRGLLGSAIQLNVANNSGYNSFSKLVPAGRHVTIIAGMRRSTEEQRTRNQRLYETMGFPRSSGLFLLSPRLRDGARCTRGIMYNSNTRNTIYRAYLLPNIHRSNGRQLTKDQ